MIKTSRFLASWAVPAALLGLLLTLGQACSGEDSNSGQTCTPGQQVNCPCPGGSFGVQICGADGVSFGVCECGAGTGGAGGNAPLNCGDAVVNDAEGEECDDGNAINNDGCTNACTEPRCGDAIQQAGEDCDDGENGEFDVCPDDCMIGGGGGAGGVNCMGQVTYAGMTPLQPSVWNNAGNIGIEAGNSLCQAIGADHFCDYEEIQAALALGELNNDPNIVEGMPITAWVHRNTPAMVNGVMVEGGPGGRCNNWTYGTNHIADGEFVTLDKVAAVVTATYTLDNDTIYDGTANHSQPGLLDCGANAGGPQRRILCCYPKCIP